MAISIQPSFTAAVIAARLLVITHETGYVYDATDEARGGGGKRAPTVCSARTATNGRDLHRLRYEAGGGVEDASVEGLGLCLVEGELVRSTAGNRPGPVRG
jgi:hypothetical protein